MSYTEDLLGPRIFVDGVEVSPRRKAIEIIGGTAEDNPETGRTEITVGGEGGGGGSGNVPDATFQGMILYADSDLNWTTLGVSDAGEEEGHILHLANNGSFVGPQWGTRPKCFPGLSLSGASVALDEPAYPTYTIAAEHPTAMTVTVPSDDTISFPDGTQIHVYQASTGQVTFVPETPATILSAESLKLRKQYSAAVLTKLDDDTWLLTGDLELA